MQIGDRAGEFTVLGLYRLRKPEVFAACSCGNVVSHTLQALRVRKHCGCQKITEEKRLIGEGRAKQSAAREGFDLPDSEFQRLNGTRQCVLCGTQDQQLHIDHCHRTNRVRSALCSACNCGLGHFEDSVLRLLRAACYLVYRRVRFLWQDTREGLARR